MEQRNSSREAQSRCWSWLLLPERFHACGAAVRRRPRALAARPAALGAHVGQGAATQPAQRLTEARGQAVTHTHRPCGGALARL